MPAITRTLAIGGALTGKTVTLNGVPFVDGKITLTLPEPEMESMHRYFSTCYQAKLYKPGEERQEAEAADVDAGSAEPKKPLPEESKPAKGKQ